MHKLVQRSGSERHSR